MRAAKMNFLVQMTVVYYNSGCCGSPEVDIVAVPEFQIQFLKILACN